jgi:hypothetical protein
MLALTVICIVAVLAAVWTRIAHVSSDHAGLRGPATALTVITPIGLMIFTVAGPLQSGWARRAGTPASLLGAHSSSSSTGSAGIAGSSAGGAGSRPVALTGPFLSTVAGTVHETPAANGAVVDLLLNVRGQVRGVLRVRIGGTPIGAGLSMTGSQVDLALAGVPTPLEGSIGSLRGSEFNARLTDSQGSTVDVHAALQIDVQSDSVTGTLSGTPGHG